MSECKPKGNLELAKKDLIRVIMFAFAPLPEELEKIDGMKFVVPFSNGRQIIMSFNNEGGSFKISAEFESSSSNIGCLIGKAVVRYDKDDDSEKPIEECLGMILDKLYSF